MKKRKIIIPAILSILACGSIAAGSTYALFTSESKVNVAITSGKVEVNATLSGLEAYSPTEIATDGTISNNTNLANNENEIKVFGNGGTAQIDEGTLKLSNVTPGDKVSFDIKINNKSSVKALYRVVIGCNKDNGLFEGLDVNLNAGDLEFTQNVSGITAISKYVQIEPNSIEKSIKVDIELPSTKGNTYAGKECEIECKVEAVQANAQVEEVEASTLRLYSATDLVSYSKLESECTSIESALYNYTTIELMNDIDMNGIEWTPIMGRSGSIKEKVNYVTTFEGNGYTISNLKANETTDGSYYYSGFFGCVARFNISNLIIAEATIDSTHYAGGIAGQLLYNSKLENCKVTNSKITSTIEDKNNDGTYDNGDKVGGLVGHVSSNGITITKCEVSGCEITGYRDIGGFFGYAEGDLVINSGICNNNTIKSIVKLNEDNIVYNYKNILDNSNSDLNLGEIIGRNPSNISTNNVSTNNNTIVKPFSE